MDTGTHLETPARHARQGLWSQAESVEDFRHHLAAVRARIGAACGRLGRDPAGVRPLPAGAARALPDGHYWPAG